MSTLFSLGTPMIQALGWTLLHSIWQALLVYGCLKAVLYLWPDASARTKYNLSFLSMAGIFGWFCITLWEQVAAAREWGYQLVYDAEAVIASQPVASVVIHETPVPESIFPHLAVCFPLLVALYVAGVAVMLIKLLVDVRQLYYIKTRQVSIAETIQSAYLPKLAAVLGISRSVQVMVSEYLQVPVMIGVLKPVILLPVAMLSQLSTEQLEAILLHELAHIKRNDYLLNIFQSIVETLLFFNPFVWWISKNIRLEREHCCDDLVVAHTAHPLHYAKALVALEEYRFTSNSLAMAAADDKQHLFHRIKRIMEMKTKHLNYSQRLLAMLIIAGSLISIAWLNPDHRQEKKDIPTPALHEQVVTDTVAPAIATAGERSTAADAPAPVAVVPALAVTDTVLPRSEKAAAPADTYTNDGIFIKSDGDSSFRVLGDSSIQLRFQKRLDRITNDANKQTSRVVVTPRLMNINTNNNIDWEKIDTEVEAALNNIDWGKINQDIARAKKDANVDAAEVRRRVDAAVKQGLRSAKESMKKVDMKGLQRELALVQRDLAGIDFRRISDDAMKGVDFDKLSAETRKSLKEAQAQSQEAIRKAFDEMKKGQEAMRNDPNLRFRDLAFNGKAGHVVVLRDNNKDIDYKDMIEQLKGERLIDTDRSFSVKLRGGQLYINGDKQSEDVKQRYHRYIDNVKSLTISGSKSSLSISVSK